MSVKLTVNRYVSNIQVYVISLKGKSLKIVIIDGRGGRVGRMLAETVLKYVPNADITAVGTNSIATAGMSKAGIKNVATGENAVTVACRTADIITGPQGIVVADALFGEVTPKMAKEIGRSNAVKVLLPFSCCNIMIVGLQNIGVTELVEAAAQKIFSLIENN